MKLNATKGNGNFNILNNETEVLELKYKNWFSSSASTHFDNKEIEIKPKSIWHLNTFEIFQNEIKIGDIAFNWRSNAVITINNETYLFKAKGICNLEFELLNQKEDKILLVKPTYNWKKMKYDYEIEFVSENYEINQLIELLVYVGFSANQYIRATLRN